MIFSARSIPPHALRVLVAWLAAMFVALVAPPSFAQALDVSASVDADEIELGDFVTYTLKATSTTSDSPSDPKLAAPSGMTVVGSDASPSHMVSIVNGRRSDKNALTARWRLRSDRLGTFTIGPGSVEFGGKRHATQAIRITVVPPGKAKPKPKQPSASDPFAGSAFDPFGGRPFDPFRHMFPGLDDDGPTAPQAMVDTDPRLSLPNARAPVAFLHAVLDKTRATVGEQVTQTIYLYEDLDSRAQLQVRDIHEPTAVDFVKRSLVEDESQAVHVGFANVGGRPWSVKRIRKSALFPIKSGSLSIGPMTLSLVPMRSGHRESESFVVEVTPPPIASRPVGYQLGDTGDFALSSQVTPRESDQNGAIGVTVELRGTGNLPLKLPLPEVRGVEWLEPTVTERLGATSSERFGGTRTWSFVVRLHEAGSVDLGAIRLPYYDPVKRAYAVATTELGIVEVRPVAGAAPRADETIAILPPLGAPRNALENAPARALLTERVWFWPLVLALPFVGALVLAVQKAWQAIRRARAARKPSPAELARERVAETERFLERGDASAAAAAMTRALEAHVLSSAGVNLKGISAETAFRELTLAGIDDASANKITRLYGSMHDTRFSPTGVDLNTARDLWDRAKTTMNRIQGTKASVRPAASASALGGAS